MRNRRRILVVSAAAALAFALDAALERRPELLGEPLPSAGDARTHLSPGRTFPRSKPHRSLRSASAYYVPLDGRPRSRNLWLPSTPQTTRCRTGANTTFQPLKTNSPVRCGLSYARAQVPMQDDGSMSTADYDKSSSSFKGPMFWAAGDPRTCP